MFTVAVCFISRKVRFTNGIQSLAHNSSSTPMLCSHASLSQYSTDAFLETIRNHKFEDNVFTYTNKDVIEYALGVGASLPDDMHYVYEQHPKFSVVPSYPTVFGINMVTSLKSIGFSYSEELNFNKILHSEQYIEVYRPFDTSGQLTMTTKLLDILDKRKFSELVFDNYLYNDSGEKLGKMQSVLLCTSSSRFGRRGKCADKISPILPPRRPPDTTYHDRTTVNQAALYRLCGDLNPLHIDPRFSSLMGFQQPILHGLCCYGFALRHVLKVYGNDDTSVFKSMKVLFSMPVIPGEGILTEMWCEGSRIIFQMKVGETNRVALTGGFVDLNI